MRCCTTFTINWTLEVPPPSYPVVTCHNINIRARRAYASAWNAVARVAIKCAGTMTCRNRKLFSKIDSSRLLPQVYSSRQQIACSKATEGRHPPPPYHAALSHQYSGASFATLLVLSCLHSPGLGCSCCNVVRFSLWPSSTQFGDGYYSTENRPCTSNVRLRACAPVYSFISRLQDCCHLNVTCSLSYFIKLYNHNYVARNAPSCKYLTSSQWHLRKKYPITCRSRQPWRLVRRRIQSWIIWTLKWRFGIPFGARAFFCVIRGVYRTFNKTQTTTTLEEDQLKDELFRSYP
jgi:hypothetical protein